MSIQIGKSALVAENMQLQKQNYDLTLKLEQETKRRKEAERTTLRLIEIVVDSNRGETIPLYHQSGKVEELIKLRQMLEPSKDKDEK